MGEIEVKANDLVMIRLSNNLSGKYRQRHYNTWFRVVFVDLDRTFIGRLEKAEIEFVLHKIGEDVRLEMDKVARIYEQGQQWCYSDGVTICKCEGICRNK